MVPDKMGLCGKTEHQRITKVPNMIQQVKEIQVDHRRDGKINL
jgi:hypothetical protein